MAAIPSGGSLVATHDYYRRRLGSASGNSACGGADCAGEAAPQRPGEGRPPTAAAGPWWAGFFSGRSALASTATVLQSPARTTPKRKLRESHSLLSKPHASLPDTLELCALHQVENKLQAASGPGGVREL
ncbi:pancreatic progenitor cell differentiation and proliferation factor isoform X1 [Canis lupus baileyi]|uniref:pancreatic progenitor cell differentiation and proliferation factor-like n=1 Tax=Canis lupus familiaris TaxID=9615 RepID=UPI000DC6BA7D|nr:pancreatic progenitor cell differentiation and proliferation factor isoform X1 [Canis lupus dingo]XP_038290296.1 pancreatic progenitor cell differentiation and proliferation factor-like [Canis lupus familiaris]XP_038290304.1 pancreatic progenitor cell differentiation and proliferation factor-like [Canis lupus familiaris]XP_038313477.1 pancreatic progenitor cell differentiation and proliferation factor-like [Canis lupus familiaris]XP_038428803.1 pancreatic progenitor cell differentiation and 